ncbi:Fanconi anemia group M protein [Amia ocellicauda]|uniref:Fanconi anemia group M protein n=1 Tax=Amia ocellicauda TaxID=2972642 RepID=UPI003463D26A
MLVAVYEAEKSLQSVSHTWQEDDAKAKSTPLPSVPLPVAATTTTTACPEDLPGFDPSSADVWIYPTNYPVRDYQLKISEAALFQNTLVCLPTGLGKTFIASVVMYNFYRWYPSGKIVFMAPTKPLVAQQIEACYKVMGIPQEHMAELTGSTQAQTRKEIWRSRRVFFLTPQVMVNDLSREACPAPQVKCVVIDEAHKALGNHAYCQVVRELGSHRRQFRILALSATPGSDTRAVQQVISNLLISHIELRSEESPDIQAHSHRRSLEKMVVPLGEELLGYQARYLQVLDRFTSRLTQLNALSHRDIRSLTKYQLILARDQFRNIPPSHIAGAQLGMLEGDFALCISLYHGYELLLQMGLRSLFLFMQGIMDGTKEMPRARNELQRNQDFMELYREMEALFVKPSKGPSTGLDEPFIYSHPKLRRLEEVVLEHFRSWSEPKGPGGSEVPSDGVSTRVMIFSSFRESVQEIATMLNRHLPLVRVMTFMGQASAGKGVRGFTQKEQLEVVRRFREGGFNTLVSTCVGEEGLDIGEVDLIVCFDAQKSPIRLVQRMGRTGRKRHGRIVVILAEGREERTYNQSQSNKRSVYKSILGNKQGFHMYPNSPRMLPVGVTPALHKMFITSGQFEHKDTSRRSSKGRRADAESFLYPRAPGGGAGPVRTDGLLSPEEFSIWSSSMRLGEEELRPTMPHSRFLSIADEAPPMEGVSAARSREMSLWEWRHWQNRLFPVSRVDHSSRCQHFTEIMDLIDSIRQEDKGSCTYELELMPFLQKEDVIGYKGDGALSEGLCGQNNLKLKRPRQLGSNLRPFGSKQKHSSSSSCLVGEVDKDFVVPGGSSSKRATSSSTSESPGTSMVKDGVSGPKGNGVQADLCELLQAEAGSDMEVYDYLDDECVIITDETEDQVVKSVAQNELKIDNPSPSSSDHISAVECDVFCQAAKLSADTGYSSQAEESSSDLTGMFYLPEGSIISETNPAREIPDNIRIILAKVQNFLARSPPNESDFECPLEQTEATVHPEHQQCLPFQINFSLDDELESECEEEDSSSSVLSNNDMEFKPQVSHHALTKETPLLDNSTSKHTVSRALSPSWDEVFDDITEEPLGHDDEDAGCGKSGLLPQPDTVVDENSIHSPTGKLGHQSRIYHNPPTKIDDSMDLFEDDDLFLHVSIPDPSASMTQKQECLAEPVQEVDRAQRNPVALGEPKAPFLSPLSDQQKLPDEKERYNCSEELFSVNFDLGFSLEDCEDELSDEDTASRHEVELPVHSTGASTGEGDAETHLRAAESLASSPKSRPAVDPHSKKFSTPLAGPCDRRVPPILKEPSLFSPIAQPFATPVSATLISPAGRLQRAQSATFLPVNDSGSALRSRSKGRLTSSIKRTLLPTGDSSSGKRLVDHLKGVSSSDSEEEAVLRWQGKRNKPTNPLSSPASKTASDAESPVHVTRRRRGAALNTSEESEPLSDQDFQESSVKCPRAPRPRSHTAGDRVRRPKAKGRDGRKFLDEEAELSEEGGAPSSDEVFDSSAEQDHSLGGFVVDNVAPSQGLDDSDMHGVYLKSVRSPVVHNKYKMVYKPRQDLDIYSQVPEADESYMEDSFVVQGSEEEGGASGEDSDEEELGGVELLPEDSFIGGRKLYPTRRRVRLREARGAKGPTAGAGKKTKPSRIIIQDDSSEEEEEEGRRKRVKGDPSESTASLHTQVETPRLQKPVFKTPQAAAPLALRKAGPGPAVLGASLEERCRQQLSLQASVSEALAFQHPASTESRPAGEQAGQCVISQATGGQDVVHAQHMCVLADSRGIGGGPEVLSGLRLRHGVAAKVSSLGACDFIVSNRMAVERQTLSEISSSTNHGRLVARIQSLQSCFDRVCLIVEKDRTKPGEVWRPPQRSRYYDSTLAALIRAGVRLLFSDGADDTAALLAELARVEQRKNYAITVPTEVKGHRQQCLQFYLTIPGVSYVTALNMCQRFSSVWHVANSSVDALVSGACVSQQKAEEIYRCLRYTYDPHMLPNRPASSAKKRSLSATPRDSR